MRRVEQLERTDPEVLRDIEQGLKTHLAASFAAESPRSAGVQAISAILDAMPNQDRAELVTGLSRYDARLSEVLAAGPNLDADTEANGEQVADAKAESAYPESAYPEFRGLTSRRGVRRSTLAMEREVSASREVSSESRDTTYRVDSAESRGDAWSGDASAASQPSRHVPVYQFDDLTQLDAKSIALVIHHADAQVLLLSLAGADESVFESLKRGLDPADLRTFERRINRLGSLQLRDIDAAQESLAQTATELAARGLIPMPSGRDLMATV